MTLTAYGHHKGDPTKFCERLTVYAGDWTEAEQLALLFRVLSNKDQRARVLELADRVECEDAALADVAAN